MGTITATAVEVLRPYTVDGGGATVPRDISPADLAGLFAMIDAALSAIGITATVTVAKATKAALDADLAHAATTLALVHSDATAANNGVYQKSGSSGAGGWTQKYQLDSAWAAAIATLQSEMDAVEGGVAALGDRADLTDAAVAEMAGGVTDRPGEAPGLFSALLTGAWEDRTPLPTALVDARPDGQVILATGELIVAPRGIGWCNPDRVYMAYMAVRRYATADPANDAVDLGVQWLTAGRAAFQPATVLRQVLDLDVGDGVRVYLATFAGFLDDPADGSDPFIGTEWPAGAAGFSVYARTYGSSHETGILRVGWRDVTEAYAASVSIADVAATVLGNEESIASLVASKADKATTVMGGGLATGGGSLASDRVLTVSAASNEQATEGESTSVAMTPAADKAALDARVGPVEDDVEALQDSTDDLEIGAAILERRTAGVEALVGEPVLSDAPQFPDGVTIESGIRNADSRYALGVTTDGAAFAGRMRVLYRLDFGEVAILAAETNYPWGVVQEGGTVAVAVDRASGNLLVGTAIGAPGDTVIKAERGPYAFAVHKDGQVALGIVADDPDVRVGTGLRGADGTRVSFDPHSNYAWCVRQGDVVKIGVTVDGDVLIDGAPGESFAAADALNLSLARRYRETVNTTVQPIIVGYNLHLGTGQSLREGYEAFPAVSRVALAGNYSIGTSADGDNTTATFNGVGDDDLHPLRARTLSQTIPRVELTDGEEAVLAPSATNVGEAPDYGAANHLRALMEATLPDGGAGRLFIANNVANGGKTIEELSEGNATGLWGRVSTLLDKVDTAVTAESESWAVASIGGAQGEANYITYIPSRGSATAAGYETGLGSYLDDLVAACMAETGQAKPPAVFWYQTSGPYVRDVDGEGRPGLHVSMAQLKMAFERPGFYMFGPSYPHGDKYGHLDANGSRWMGCQEAKVKHKVLVLRQDWLPVMPVKIEATGPLTTLVHFHVPEPPLKWKPVLHGSTVEPGNVLEQVLYPYRGFSVFDGGGANPLSTAPELIGQTMVRLTKSRATVGTETIVYGDKATHQGNGNLCDSDLAVASMNYEYLPELGMYESANIESLVGKPYPLENWCVLFALETGFDLYATGFPAFPT